MGMFKLTCGKLEPHEAHQHEVKWRKEDLPFLRNAADYPDEWTATYDCTGVVGAHDNWDTVQVHTECPDCEELINEAVAIAKLMGVERWSHYKLPHAVTVKRVTTRV